MYNFSKNELNQLQSIMLDLGHELDDEALYGAAVALVRFVVSTESLKVKEKDYDEK